MVQNRDRNSQQDKPYMAVLIIRKSESYCRHKEGQFQEIRITEENPANVQIVYHSIPQQSERPHLQTVNIGFALSAVPSAVVKVSEPHSRIDEDDIIEKNHHGMHQQEREGIDIGVDQLSPTRQVEIYFSLYSKNLAICHVLSQCFI